MGRDAALAQWVRDHRATWEVAPHRGTHGEAQGYDIVVFARHPELRDGDPGCLECRRIYMTLCELVAHAMPAPPPGVRIALSPFDASFRMRANSGWAPEIALGIEVTPRGLGGAGDAALQDCVHEIESGLQRLGAQSGWWRSPD